MKLPALKTPKNLRFWAIALLIITIPVVTFLSWQQQNAQQNAQGRIKVGVNVQGMVHYGYGDTMNYMPGNYTDEALAELQAMGVRVVRVFVGNNRISDAENADRLNTFLNRAQRHNISVIVNLMHFFDIYGMRPQGTDHFYTNNVNLGGMNVKVLNHDFWNGGYLARYKPYVTTIVQRNKDHPNVYAWEPCNECRDHEGNRVTFLNFMKDITSHIKSIDPNTAISSGEEGSRVTGYSAAEFYGQLPNVDIVSIHVYNGDRDPAGDAAWARANGKRILIGEIGFSVPNGNRPNRLRDELNYWESQGAELALHWAYMGSTFAVWQDGDGDSGIVKDQPDYNDLKCVISQFNGVNCGGTPPTNTPVPTAPPGQPTNTPAPQGNSPPVGGLDVIDSQGRAFGHAIDPDIPNAQIQVHFWVDGPEGSGTYAGTVNANQDFNNGKGAHSFIFTIPNNFRDGQNHTLYAYGLDYQCVTNGHLGGSPKTFNLRDTAPPDPTNAPEPPPPAGNNPHPETNPPPNPKNLRVSCNLANRTARITWESGGSSPWTDFYTLTVTGTSISGVRVYGTGYTVPIQLGKRYSWWINSVNHTANYAKPNLSDTIAGRDIECDYPPLPTPPNPRPTATPGGGGGGDATIIIRLRNEIGQPVVVNTGTIFIDNLADSDTYNLAGAAVQDRCSKRTAPGEYQCVKYAASWYAGMGNSAVPSGFCVVDGGIRREESDSPLPVTAGGTITVNVVLKPGNCGLGSSTPTPAASNILNCLNIQGPTTIRLGQSATFLTQFSSKAGFVKAGMGALPINTSSADPASWSWNPSIVDVQDRSGSRSFSWTPTSEGTYQLFCRAINAADNSECRGSPSSVQSPVSTCTGPGGTLVVNVTSQELGQGSGTDICSQIVLFGSGTAMTLGQQTGNPGLTPNGSVSVAAIAKPGFNIKSYSFAFYNADNQPTDPKPLSFEAGKQFIIESKSNNINLNWNDVNKPDLNYGNRKPAKVQIAAFFTDALGRTSTKSPACIASLALTIPTPTAPAAATPTLSPSPTPNPAIWAGVAAIIIAIIATSFYFFFN